MKQVLICSLAVMAMGGVANAQNLTLWLADKADGDGHIVMNGPSDTAVMQLWMEVPDEMILITVDAILRGYDSSFGKDLHFEVQGFNDIVIPDSLLQRVHRGEIAQERCRRQQVLLERTVTGALAGAVPSEVDG